jgi:hypothetical protein
MRAFVQEVAMRLWLLPVLAATLSVAAVPCQEPGGDAGADVIGADAAAWKPHRSLRVLYAGWPKGSRETAFRAFLERHFDRVEVIDLAKLNGATAKDADVVIADWCSQYGNDGYAKRENSLYSAPGQLGVEFTKPVIAMAYVSSNLRRQYKLDWL